MTVNTRMREKKLTKYRLSKISEIPYTTIGDICSGKTDLKKCSAETVYKLAKALDISMEELLSDAMSERPDFALFKRNVCRRVQELGDLEFIIEIVESRIIRTYYERKWYTESLYLLAMLDYLSRVNDIPLCGEYDDLRICHLKETVYPSCNQAASNCEANEQTQRAALRDAIPEFIRFNIAETDVRNFT